MNWQRRCFERRKSWARCLQDSSLVLDRRQVVPKQVVCPMLRMKITSTSSSDTWWHLLSLRFLDPSVLPSLLGICAARHVSNFNHSFSLSRNAVLSVCVCCLAFVASMLVSRSSVSQITLPRHNQCLKCARRPRYNVTATKAWFK